MASFHSSDPSPTSPQPTPPRRVDIHCHCLPGVDDGPADMDEALALCRMLVHDGFSDIIATPHQLGRYESANSAAQIRHAVAHLQQMLVQKHIPLKIHCGGEVRVDERIPKLLQSDTILTLADQRRYLLLELSLSAYIEPAGLLPYLAGTGLSIILAHAERYSAIQRNPTAVEAWLAGGAVIQVNADSIVGAAGAPAAKLAWELLTRGWVSLVATDAHSASTRRPRMTEAINMIRQELGGELAAQICITNPLSVLEGHPLPAPPGQHRGSRP
jgi:protein-tyrosine phosphatase